MSAVNELLAEDFNDKAIDVAHKSLPARDVAITKLLANIKTINLQQVCVQLGWQAGNDGKPPKQKHYKVAIVHVLIEAAKKIIGTSFMMPGIFIFTPARYG